MPKLSLNEVINRLLTNDAYFKELHILEISAKPTLKKDRRGTFFEISLIDDEVLIQLSKAIEYNYTLESITIKFYYDNSYSAAWTHQGTEAIGRAISNHPKIKYFYVSLGMCQTFKRNGIGFLNALTGNSKLYHLELNTNTAVDLTSLKKIGEFLIENVSLKKIKIDDCGWNRSSKHDEASLAIFTSGFSNKQFTSLSLDRLDLNDKGFKLLISALLDVTTLTQLSLTGIASHSHTLTTSSMQMFHGLIKNNPKLTYLNLSSNKIENEGLKLLAEALPFIYKLKFFDLSSCDLEADVLEHLIKVWRINNLKIQVFQINGHKIDFSKNSLLTTLLHQNKFLKSLGISSNSITEQSILPLKSLLSDSNNCHLNQLSFRIPGYFCNPFYSELLDIIQSNPHLIKVGWAYSLSTQHMKAIDLNHQKHYQSQQVFVNTTILLSNLYYSMPLENDKAHLSCLPIEIFLILMRQFEKVILGMTKENKLQCYYLILENFSLRRNLIENNKYSPYENNGINSWWSMWTRTDEPKKIFTIRTEMPNSNKDNSSPAKRLKCG